MKNPRRGNTGRGPRQDKSSTCHYCNKPGHWIRDCRNKQADEKGPTGPQGGLAMMAKTKQLTLLLSTWIADSGCSFHMTPRSEWICNYTPFEEAKQITLGDNHCIPAVGRALSRHHLENWKRYGSSLVVPRSNYGTIFHRHLTWVYRWRSMVVSQTGNNQEPSSEEVNYLWDTPLFRPWWHKNRGNNWYIRARGGGANFWGEQQVPRAGQRRSEQNQTYAHRLVMAVQ